MSVRLLSFGPEGAPKLRVSSTPVYRKPKTHSDYIRLKEAIQLKKCYRAELKKKQTPAEKTLQKRIGSIGFKSQVIILGWIVDFYSKKQRIVVEVDGGYHLSKEQQKSDNTRNYVMRSKGYIVLRFTNDQVFCDINSVVKEIKSAMQQSKQQDK